jgi:hypothetical protein
MTAVAISVTCAKCGGYLYHHVGAEWVEKDGQLRGEIVVITAGHLCEDKDEADD